MRAALPLFIYSVAGFIGAAWVDACAEEMPAASASAPAFTSASAAMPAAPAIETWNAKFQSTYIWQTKPAFPAAYTGPNSLLPTHESSHSVTITASFGLRLWHGGELYVDPEAAAGVPLSGLTGLGGFTNGEMARTSGPRLKLYAARAFLRQTWDDGHETDVVDSDMDQLGGVQSQRRWVLTAGKLSVLDLFDDNAYSHDPRTQFFNWALMTYGAYDYAADARGYSWGITLERYYDNWAVRAGRFLQPREPNGLALEENILKYYGDQIEIERGHQIAGQPGRLRVLVFRNHARMSRFQDAIDLAEATDTTPELNAVRYGEQTKVGVGINLEQALTDNIGLFARASKADGKTETYAFTEIDDSLSAGLLVKGAAWHRANDALGIAGARNGISQARRQYLEMGGISYFIGDGRLNYHPEEIIEVFYNVYVIKYFQVSLDWQRIKNPAYNGDRGPVDTYAIRLHTEF